MRRLLGALALAAVLGLAGPALAARAPGGAERQAITTAIKDALKDSGSPAAARARVHGIRVSTKDGRWAFALVSAPNTDEAYVALQRRGGAWRMRNLGTAMVQCGIGMPKAVMNELFAAYGGTNCPA
jgi:hypothetical protein